MLLIGEKPIFIHLLVVVLDGFTLVLLLLSNNSCFLCVLLLESDLLVLAEVVDAPIDGVRRFKLLAEAVRFHRYGMPVPSF